MKTTMIIVALCVVATLRSFGQSPSKSSKGYPYCASEPMHKLDQRLAQAQATTMDNGGSLYPGNGGSYGSVSSRGQAYKAAANNKPASVSPNASVSPRVKDEE